MVCKCDNAGLGMYAELCISLECVFPLGHCMVKAWECVR
jgi:hypothetical protein